MLTFHDDSSDRYVAALTTTITIGIHFEAKFITLASGEWWTVVDVVKLLAFGVF